MPVKEPASTHVSANHNILPWQIHFAITAKLFSL